jgi:hypothetical protein
MKMTQTAVAVSGLGYSGCKHHSQKLLADARVFEKGAHFDSSQGYTVDAPCTRDSDYTQMVGDMMLVVIGIASSQNAEGCKKPDEEEVSEHQPREAGTDAGTQTTQVMYSHKNSGLVIVDSE